MERCFGIYDRSEGKINGVILSRYLKEDEIQTIIDSEDDGGVIAEILEDKGCIVLDLFDGIVQW